MSGPGYLERMLRLAHQCDIRHELDWTTNLGGDEIIFVVECAELFFEHEYETVPVTPADMDAFEKALRDVGDATEGDYTYGPALYACRIRGKRPHNMGYPTDARVHPLFEAVVVAPPKPDLSGKHAVVEAHIPGATTRTFVFPPDRFIVGSTTGNGIHSNPPKPAEKPAEVPTEVPAEDPVEEPETVELRPADPEALSAGDGWPVLVDGKVEPPPHPCAPTGSGGPDHCGLCGRSFSDKEMELAAKHSAAVHATGHRAASLVIAAEHPHPTGDDV